MSILKLKPSFKDYIWGGRRLIEEFGKEYEGSILAESWELSCHPSGPSSIINGVFSGLTLPEYIEKQGKSVLGTNCDRFQDFPVLIKLIDAKESLSIQVHPSDDYALKHENQYGKTEMWYIVDAKENSFLYYGFKKDISKEEFKESIKNDSILDILNKVYVKKGDVLFIESGTIHAIGKDILIAEIQQNSSVTYRVYDYGRIGVDGNPRELHIEKALDVTKRAFPTPPDGMYPHLADCDYFTVDKLLLDGEKLQKITGRVNEDSFLSILILDGNGTISCEEESLSYTKGDTFFLPANSGIFELKGSCEALLTSIRT